MAEGLLSKVSTFYKSKGFGSKVKGVQGLGMFFNL